MWVEVYLYYLYHKSERKYVDIGKLDLARNTLNIGTSVIYIFPKALHFNIYCSCVIRLCIYACTKPVKGVFVCRCLYVSLCMYITGMFVDVYYGQIQYLHMHVYVPTKFHNAGYILRQYCQYCQCNTIVMQEHTRHLCLLLSGTVLHCTMITCHRV